MKALTRLNTYFLRYKGHLLLGILFITLSNLFAIYPAQIFRDALDAIKLAIDNYSTITAPEEKATYYQNIAKQAFNLGALVFIMALLRGVFMFFMRQTIIVMSRHIEYDMKNDIFQHYQKLPPSFYKKNKTGDLMNRISEDVSKVRMYIGPAVMYSISLITLFILVIATMLKVNAELTFYVLIPLPILAVGIYFINDSIIKKSEDVQASLSQITSFVQETFSGIRVIKTFVQEELTNKVFEEVNQHYKNKSMNLVKYNALFFPLIMLLIGLSTLLTIYIGGKKVMAKEITIGNIGEFIIYVNMLTWPIASIGWVTAIMQRAAASQKRINEFLDTQPELFDNALFAGNKPVIKGSITFKNVSFQYDTVTALRDISFTIDAGKTLAIVGKTGSGKSTIANLICRMLEPQAGEILIDHHHIQTISVQHLRQHIGYVPQDVFLFSDTIKANIAFGVNMNTIDEAEIIQAAKDAGILNSILDLPKQFDTTIGERGVMLSGGQKQRIGIARAIIKSPQILIFDDCLSAVDTATEDLILNNLKRIMAGKTTMIISHRISSVKYADNIIVLANGCIVEQGNHNSLIQQRGIYYNMYQEQLLNKVQQ